MKYLMSLSALALLAGVGAACPPLAALALDPAASCDCAGAAVQTVPEAAPLLVPRQVTTYAVPRAVVVAAAPAAYVAPQAVAVRSAAVYAPRAFVFRSPVVSHGAFATAAVVRAPVVRRAVVTKGVVPSGANVNVNVFRKLKIKNSVVR